MNKKNLRILNTRPVAQANALSLIFLKAGAIPVELPMLGIEATPLNWTAQMPIITNIQTALFISPNAVLHFFNAIPPTSWLPSINTIAMGQGTAQALIARSITVHQTPACADSEHLLALNTLEHINNQTILLIKGEGGRPLIQQTLAQRGAKVTALAVYRRTVPNIHKKYLHALWHEDAVDMIFMTSQEAMQNLFTLLGEDARPWLCSKPFLVLSQRLANIASEYGIKDIVISDYHTLSKTLEEYTNER